MLGGVGIAAFGKVNSDGTELTSSFIGHYTLSKVANAQLSEGFGSYYQMVFKTNSLFDQAPTINF